jgi:hypothetical protein
MTIAISDTAKIPAGTFGINIHFTVMDNDGSAHDLTLLTVTLKVWKAGESPIVTGSVTLDVAASGPC